MPTNYALGITRTVGNWNFQGNTVERPTDNASYEAAHPDDTILLAGVARRDVSRPNPNGLGSMLAIGQVQSFTTSSGVQLIPVQGIGSGRCFFLRGKAQTTWQMQKLILNGRNLLRSLYHNASVAGIPVHQLDDPAATAENSQFWINLDSELYYIPFGLGFIMRTKAHSLIMSIYLELCMINSYSTAIMQGQPMIAESVTGMCDRILPWQTTDAMAQGSIPRSQMDRALGIGATAFPDPTNARTTIGQFTDTGLDNGTIPSIST
jgi:hypothetical protein